IFDRKYWTSLTFIRLLPYVLCFIGIAFDIAGSITVALLGLHHATAASCKEAMYICLAFYCSTKVCVELFLIERAHAVRHKLKRRLHDPVWLAFMFILICGFGAIAILAFIAPVGVVNRGDGQCRIGLPRKAVMLLMTYDILMNIALTGVFIVLLWPLLRFQRARSAAQNSLKRTGDAVGSMSGNPSKSSDTSSEPVVEPLIFDRDTQQLKELVFKSVFGTIIMMTATIFNLVFLFRYDGQEHGWICFMCCLLDVTWTVSVIHFITETKREDIGPALARQAWSNERMNWSISRPRLTRNQCSEG
ncbi:MAG: hypothetical protein FE78DRAFT_146676, partial [Acidomyces sp. 'richmondensis']